MPHLLIVSARFYETLAHAMEARAEATLAEAGATWDKVTVPGALEIPAAIRFDIETKKYDGFIALGCVIRGETYHFEIVCNESARGLTWLTLEHGACIGNGILTVENEEQAQARVNKGGAAAEAALELIALKRRQGKP